MNWRDHIVADPAVCHGQPCFKGTRVLVSVVLDNLAEGVPIEDLMKSYPSVTDEAVHAAIAYAADMVRERVVGM